MNKICTSLEQSKRLIELGIDINTADMKWFDGVLMMYFDKESKENYDKTNHEYIPAWSLSALLELMQNFTLNRFGNGQFNCRDERADCYALVNTCPLDVAFEMVCWLKENGKI